MSPCWPGGPWLLLVCNKAIAESPALFQVQVELLLPPAPHIPHASYPEKWTRRQARMCLNLPTPDQLSLSSCLASKPQVTAGKDRRAWRWEELGRGERAPVGTWSEAQGFPQLSYCPDSL